jgi:hypothetical protein
MQRFVLKRFDLLFGMVAPNAKKMTNDERINTIFFITTIKQHHGKLALHQLPTKESPPLS